MGKEKKPHVLVLGGNFGGLTAARFIRERCGDSVSMTLVDRKPYLVFVPNIPIEVMANRDPQDDLHMPIHRILRRDDIDFIQADVTGIDLDAKSISCVPTERLGAATEKISYDYLVVALGCRLAYDRIDGDKLRVYLHEDGYKGGPVAIGSARFHQGDRGRPDWLPTSKSACEGPPLEIAMALASWLQDRHLGGPQNITLFTPAEVIAEDAGEEIVHEFLDMAGQMGFGYQNKTEDIRRITADGIEFASIRLSKSCRSPTSSALWLPTR
jgi:sulfide:quinone oxidoreductase